MTVRELTNFEMVRDWMILANQTPASAPDRVSEDTLQLRSKLLSEEFGEMMHELSLLDTENEQSVVWLIKELCDMLVVTYGTLAALGVDGDKLFAAVMMENLKKLESATTRDDGKIIVDSITKPLLKRETESTLHRLVYHE